MAVSPLQVNPDLNLLKKAIAFIWRKPSITSQVVIALVLGLIVGIVAPDFAVQAKPLATLFLRMIKMIIAPLVFATLVIGISQEGNMKQIGRIGLKALIYFEIATTLALMIGLGVANWIEPGKGLALAATASQASQMTEIQANAHTVANHSFWDFFINAVPTSVVDAMARGDILQIVVFSVFFGLALVAIGEKAKPIQEGLHALSEAMFKFTMFVMAFAPVGVFGAVAYVIGENGLSVLWVFAKLIFSLYFALVLFVVCVLLAVCYFIRIPFDKLFAAVKEPFWLAFSTASSEAALPKAMEQMERFGVPKNIVGFVMPTGYSFNLDGSTLYLALAALFVAQMSGIHLDISQQIVIMLALMVTSKGIAAVPRVSLVVLTGTLAAFNLPVEGVAVLLAIDHFLDMARTSVNLMGNCVATVVVARWEGVFDDEKMQAFTGALPQEERLPEAQLA